MRIATENDWQAYRRKAGIGTYALAGLLFVVPKIGPLKMVAVKGPTVATETEYMHSVAFSTAALRRMLSQFTPPSDTNSSPSNPAPNTHIAATSTESAGSTALRPKTVNSVSAKQAADPRHPLPNRDLDTGYVVRPGGYSLTDSTYAYLLHKLTREPSQPIPPGIKEDVQAYYANPDAPISTKKSPQKWAEVQADLVTLAAMSTSPEPTPYPTYGSDADSTQ